MEDIHQREAQEDDGHQAQDCGNATPNRSLREFTQLVLHLVLCQLEFLCHQTPKIDEHVAG
jgi:hypothetical protein